jgi:protoporphyrinogen oxidase
MPHKKIAIIAGAGPAGLTAAYELLDRSDDILPIIFEKSNDIGGISKTVNYKGNRIDIGGHRFFSKSDRVMDWWLKIMAMEDTGEDEIQIQYHNKTRPLNKDRFPATARKDQDNVMLVRSRLSRIYFLKKFFNYPIQLSAETLKGLGLIRSAGIFFSYMKAQAMPRKEEHSLEDFMINRFGKKLYHTFFKDYTEKVWGIDCKEISAEWGAQRIKGLSITKAIQHALRQQFRKNNKSKGIKQKGTETSLIERFLYPKFGPGQLWEEVADRIKAKGGDIRMQYEIAGINIRENKVVSAVIRNCTTGTTEEMDCDYFFSTMPVKQLIAGISPAPAPNIRQIAAGLLYRDFITVGLLLSKLKIKKDKARPAGKDNCVQDNWIYIQEREVKVGRLQIFNNWSPFMVNDPEKIWIGMEYFCNEGDQLWTMKDEDLEAFAIEELSRIDIIDRNDVVDSTVLRMEKAYPAYFGTYNRFEELKEYLGGFTNLFLVGRNGMHKYNNSDHSMLTAMTAVDNILAGIGNKKNIWDINTEMEYHEEKK